MLLRVAEHNILEQGDLAAALGVGGVSDEVEEGRGQQLDDRYPEDRGLGRGAGHVQPELARRHLVRLQTEFLPATCVFVSRYVRRRVRISEDLRAVALILECCFGCEFIAVLNWV